MKRAKPTLLIALLTVTHVASRDALGQMPPMKVVIEKAEMKDAPATIKLVGSVRPVRRSIIASEIEGIVAEILAREGDFVQSGDPLCRLVTDTLLAQLDEARAKRDALQARHEEFLAGTRPEELRRLKAWFDEAKADAERWTKEVTRVEALYKGSSSNEKEVYDTQAEARRAEMRMVAAQAAYDTAVEGPRKEEIARAAHDLAAEQAVVARLEMDLKKAVVQAPFTGYIVNRRIEQGEWLPRGGSVFDMVDLSTVLVRVNVPEYAIPFVEVGKPANVQVDALKEGFAGRIKHVIREADPAARTFPVDIEVDNADGRIAAGMFARGVVPSGPSEPVVAVPKDAVVRREGDVFLAMAMPSDQGGLVAMLLPVTTGADIGEWITLSSKNVQPGALVVIRGNENLLPFPMPVIQVDLNGNPVAPLPDGETTSGPSTAKTQG